MIKVVLNNFYFLYENQQIKNLNYLFFLFNYVKMLCYIVYSTNSEPYKELT